MRLVILLIFMLTVWDIPVSSSAEIDSELINKVNQLEKELQELKKHQETLATPKAQKEEMPARILVAEATSSKAKKHKDTVKDDETSPQEEPNFNQSKELYDQAQIFLNQKRPDQAKVILQNLCESYPETLHFILAKYWLGEIGLASRDNTNASIAYGEAYSAYKEKARNKDPIPDGVRNRAIESLAKLAHCLKHLNKQQDACVTLEQFDKEASNIPYNIKRFARQVSEQLKCQKKS